MILDNLKEKAIKLAIITLTIISAIKLIIVEFKSLLELFN